MSNNISANEYFFNLINCDPIYEAEPIVHHPFWDFMYRFQSLQRHWLLNKEYLKNHLNILSQVESDGSAEFGVIFSETVQVDFDYFPEYLRMSIISFALSLVENVLGSLSDEIAEDLGISVELDSRNIPYIDKYLLWFTRGCGMELGINKDIKKSLNAIREIRNRFIHKIDRDIPEHIMNVINEMVSEVLNKDEVINDDFVDRSLEKLAELVKTIELAYIKFYEEK